MPWRRVALGVCALLLLVLGPAAVPEPGTTLPQVAGSGERVASWLLTADALYTTALHGRAGDYRLVAHPLVPGGPRWTRAVRSEFEQPVLRHDGDLLFVAGRDSGGTSTVLEAATGTVRWVAPGFDYVVPAGDRVLQQGRGRMALVDPATGRTLWRRLDQRGFAHVDVMGGYLVGIGDGRVATLASRTGEQIGSASIVAKDIPVGGAVIDSRAYVWTPGDLTALRLPDLGRVWTVPIAAPVAAATCGRLLCVTGAGGVTALDPATGAVRWTGTDLTEWLGGLAVTRDGRVVEIDSETGTARRELGRGRPAGDLMLRTDRDGVLWVTEQESGRIFGTLRDVKPDGCEWTGDHLACPTTDLRVTVWKVALDRLAG